MVAFSTVCGFFFCFFFFFSPLPRPLWVRSARHVAGLAGWLAVCLGACRLCFVG